MQVEKKKAAFFPLEGVLLDFDWLSLAMYYSLNRQAISERITRVIRSLLFVPSTKILFPKHSREMHKMIGSIFEGMTEDRATVLGEEMAKEILAPRLHFEMIEMARLKRSEGYRTVLLSEFPKDIVHPLFASDSPFDDILCNQWVFKNRRCTHEFQTPWIHGSEMGNLAKDFALERDLDLSKSIAFGHNTSDFSLISIVGEPCIVNGNYRLLQKAKAHQWPRIEFQS